MLPKGLCATSSATPVRGSPMSSSTWGGAFSAARSLRAREFWSPGAACKVVLCGVVARACGRACMQCTHARTHACMGSRACTALPARILDGKCCTPCTHPWVRAAAASSCGHKRTCCCCLPACTAECRPSTMLLLMG